ncbi:hypothetical protein E2I00_016424, partial [Balaenoptera physalus]
LTKSKASLPLPLSEVTRGCHEGSWPLPPTPVLSGEGTAYSSSIRLVFPVHQMCPQIREPHPERQGTYVPPVHSSLLNLFSLLTHQWMHVGLWGQELSPDFKDKLTWVPTLALRGMIRRGHSSPAGWRSSPCQGKACQGARGAARLRGFYPLHPVLGK